ncbi:MAG: hypothetical protein ABS79_04070 [Planctomycetes bacterium SCN 63-9]|nr:MAG: hypothetical protein ABS79_04070 [Planctomycetes bacterium SCN 63-9]
MLGCKLCFVFSLLACGCESDPDANYTGPVVRAPVIEAKHKPSSRRKKAVEDDVPGSRHELHAQRAKARKAAEAAAAEK